MADSVDGRVLIVDGHAYAYRSFHAIRKLNSPQGEPTNAIFGFISSLNRMRTVVQPSHLAVVWDGGLAAERMAILPGYKAQRPPMPESLDQQIQGIEAYLGAARIVSLCRDGVEADDWIAALARQAVEAGLAVAIASSDKDFLQLVTDRVAVLNPNDKSERLWGPADVKAKTGVEPGQVVDWLSLVGDAVDNIPGVAGVGPKTATRILECVGSLDAFYGNPGQLEPERLRSRLIEARETVERNKQMVRLRTELPQPMEIVDLAVRTPDADTLRPLYERWGFRRLHAELGPPAAGVPGELF
jgi:DNA polymerase-1